MYLHKKQLGFSRFLVFSEYNSLNNCLTPEDTTLSSTGFVVKVTIDDHRRQGISHSCSKFCASLKVSFSSSSDEILEQPETEHLYDNDDSSKPQHCHRDALFPLVLNTTTLHFKAVSKVVIITLNFITLFTATCPCCLADYSLHIRR